MAHKRSWLTFNRLVLFGGIAVGAAIAFGPLVREQWARATWTKLPCYRSPGGTRFVFRYLDKPWVSSRPNMWFVPHADAVPTSADLTFPPDNDVCYISGGDPPTAVLRLDAAEHLSSGIGSYVSGALATGASVVIVILSASKTKKAPPAPAREPLPPA